MAKVKKSFCWSCWRDWKQAFLDLSPWEQDQFLERNPRVNPNLYDRGRCPFCGTRYEAEMDEWFEDLLEELDED